LKYKHIRTTWLSDR